MKRFEKLAILERIIYKHLEDNENYEGDPVMFDRILEDLEQAGIVPTDETSIWTEEDSKLSVQ